MALLLSVFPETFSYALSEVLQAGLTPVAYDFGAIGERMRALGVGVTVPLGAPPEQLVAAIRAAARAPATVPVEALYGQYSGLMAKYYQPALVDLAETLPPPDLPRVLGQPSGLNHDGWCAGTVLFRLWSARPLQRLALDLWVPAEGRFQTVAVTCNGIEIVRRPIEDGGVQRIVCVLPPADTRLLEIACTFDFLFPLQPPDVRSCAAVLSAAHVNDGSGWFALDLGQGGARPPSAVQDEAGSP